MWNGYFRTLDFFMLRTPLLPLETYASGSVEREAAVAQLAEMARNPVIREAIAVASPSLLESLPNLELPAPSRKRDQAVKGLLRYWLRMMTRPTPFGLFSGVTYGTLSERARLALHPAGSHRKHTRPDMEWLLGIVEQLEKDRGIVEQLRVKLNPAVYPHGSRLKIPYVTRYGQLGSQRSMEAVSVRITPVVTDVMEAAAGMIPFQELLQVLVKKYEEAASEDVVRSFLFQLLEQEVLMTELRPPTTTASPFTYVLNKLEGLTGQEELREQLHEIRRKIAAYDVLPIGAGEQALLALIAEMKEMADVTSPLQVDLQLAKESVELPREIGEEAARAADVLWRIAQTTRGVSHLKEYRVEFIEKYGIFRDVPLLELLDEELGLGAPPTYEWPRSRHPAPPKNPSQKRERLMVEWMAEALADGRMEFELTEEHIRRLETDGQSLEQAPLSIEMYFEVAAPSARAVEEGNFRLVLGANIGSNGAGKTFGRFVDVLGEEFLPKLRQAHDAEREQEPERIFAEIAYLPHAGRATNVVLCRNVRPYEIPLGTNSSLDDAHTLPLSDLVVGCDGQSMYIKSRRLDREIIPTSGHMLNNQNAPNLYRFLNEVGLDRQRSWLPFQWGALETAPFLPRVRYGRVVLSAASWTMSQQNVRYEKDLTDAQWQERLAEWRKRWQMPRHVFLVQFDNRILLDLENPLHQDELRRELEKQTEIKLIEMAGNFGEQVVESPEGHFCSEVVIPLVRNHVAATPATVGRPTQQATAPAGKRLYLPGGEWMSIKLYGVDSRQDELIGTALREFLMRAQEAGVADAGYFVRYKDPKSHLRVRFHGEPERLTTQLLPNLHMWSKKLLEEGLLTHWVMDTYEPEVERYGGLALMPLAERLFSADSKAVSQWVAMSRFGQMSMGMNMLGVISTLDLIGQFGMTLEQQFEWFDAHFGVRDHLEEFRRDRKLYLELIGGSEEEGPGLLRHPNGAEIAKMLELRRGPVREYVAALREAGRAGALLNTDDDILASVIHMSMNRLYGTDREREKKVMILTRHALNALVQYRRNRS